ncbi:hypothetical protein BJV78DRAFT_1187093 [Lactifluus subvellereus]|nr:hypothetical protein BJV78DRAFT_1187093 [Lactifluus subvellereus]
MALQVLRASSSNISRQSWRSLSTSLPRYRETPLDSTARPNTANNNKNNENDDTDYNDDGDSDGGPPTSVVYSRANASATTTTNPLRRALSPSLSSSSPLSSLSKHVEVLPYRLHVTCTPNNTHIVLSDERGRPLKDARWTGGACGFKGVNRSGYEAGYQCAVRAFARARRVLVEEVPGARFEVRFSGFGQGRDAVVKALMTSEGDDVRPFVLRVTDKTPIKIGGTRARKTRRL